MAAAVAAVVVGFSRTARVGPEGVGVRLLWHCARRYRGLRLAVWSRAVWRKCPPSGDTVPSSLAPPARENAWRVARRFCLGARAAGRLPATSPPATDGVLPRWCCGRNFWPGLRSNSRGVLPFPIAASLVRARYRARSCEASGRAATRRLRSCPRPRLGPCRDPGFGARRCVCGRR